MLIPTWKFCWIEHRNDILLPRDHFIHTVKGHNNFWNRMLVYVFLEVSQNNSNVQNFYLLKIHLNWFEISNQVLKFENLISIWKSIILSEHLFQTWILQSGAICVYSSLLRDKVEYTQIEPLYKVQFEKKTIQDNSFSNLNQIFKFQNKFWDFK